MENHSPLIVAHHLNDLGSVGMKDYVAHILCTNGRFEFVFNGNSLMLQQGEAMIVAFQQLVEARHLDADTQIICVYVRNDFLERCTPRSNYGIRGSLALYICPIMTMDSAHFELLHHDFLQIEARWLDASHQFQEEVLICATQMMFLDFFEVHSLQNGLANISYQDSEIMLRFMEMLERGDYVKHREVGHYASELCVTPKYLSEVCKHASGKPANYWITRFATVHIRRLLQERDLSFTQIAEQFDFSSPAYFSRFVQKHLGASPTAFRE